MKIEEILDSWKEDSRIDQSDLSMESLKIPNLHHKYLQMYSRENLRFKSQRIKLVSLRKKLASYYMGELNNPEDLAEIGREPFRKKILRQEIDMYVNSDDEMVNANLRIAYQEEIVDALKEIIQSINKRNFIIKNSIEWLRFSMGG